MASINQIDVGGTTYDLNAAQLSASKNIDGVAFDGSTDIIHYGVSSTAAGTITKTVAISNFTLAAGARIAVKFTYADATGSPMLNVSSTGAKTIKSFGTWKAGDVVLFEYDGTNWVAPGFLGKYDDVLAVIKISDNTTTMGDVQSTLASVNSVGDHVLFDVSGLNAGMYLCTLYLNAGYYRIQDMVTGFEGTGFFSSTDTLYDIITSGSTSTGAHYTFVWDQVNAKGTRLNDAASITTTTTNFGHFGSVNANYDNPFDSIYPWSGRKLCNIDIPTYMALTDTDDITDCVTAWEGDDNFSYTDQYGVWCYTPGFFGRSYIVGNYRYFDVTDENLQNNVYYPPMINGRWHGADVTLTINGTSTNCNLPVTGLSMANIAVSTQHTYAKNYGGSLTDIYTVDANLLLFAVEYATMNTDAIGAGVNSLYAQSLHLSAAATNSTTVTIAANVNIIPGAVFDIGTSDGGNDIARRYVVSVSGTTVTLNAAVTATTEHYVSIHGLINVADEDIGSHSGYIGTNGKCNAYYRGEVLYGNKYQYILGAYRQTGTGAIWTAAKGTTDNYDALNTSAHTNTGLVLPTSINYIQTLGMCNGLSIPPFCTAVGGNSTNPVGDYCYVPSLSTANTILLLGGSADNGTNDGGFYGNWNRDAGNSRWDRGSRPRLKNPS